ncbi:MAG: glycerol-3-phosphate 1-O-acyltransferase PlsY [Candidatus Neomarinimicrobiota bacterium]
MILLLILLLLSYLAGSIPTSIIVGQVTRGIDIRDYGSGNAGGTNAFRVLGWKAGLVVMIVDVFKGWFAAAVIASWTIGGALGQLPTSDQNLIAILCGGAAVLGHTFTVFASFRGGKGVGTLAGMLIHLFPLAVLIGVIVWVLVLIITGYVSVGSMSAVTLFPLITFLHDGTLASSLGVFSVLMVLFIWFTHRSNIKRLLAGRENRFEKAMIFRRRRPIA